MAERPSEIITMHPEAGQSIDPEEAIAAENRPTLLNRPWVMSNMIASLDGATAVEGLSGGLGGPADQRVFLGLRATCDLIIVGAATAIDETYRPPRPSPGTVARRQARGQLDRPRIAVLTRSLSIDVDHPLFANPAYRPIIITTENAPPDRAKELSKVADLVVAGTSSVDLESALSRLTEHRIALLEGGPTLNAQFVANDLIDEWNLTTAPLLVGGFSKRAASGPEPDAPRPFTLNRMWSGDGLLFGRWLRDRQATEPG